MIRDERGRLTITDLLFVLVGLAALAALHPVYADVLDSSSEHLSGGEVVLFSTLLPVSVLVLIAIIYIEARRG